MIGGAGATAVEVKDLDRFRRVLRDIDRSLPREIIPPAFREAAEVVYLRAAEREAPVGKPSDYAGRSRRPPGRLQRSVRILASQKRVALAAGGARAFHGVFVYHGTKHIERNRFFERAVESRPISLFTGRVVRLMTIDMGRRGLEVTR